MNVKIYYKYQLIKYHKHHSQLTSIIPSKFKFKFFIFHSTIMHYNIKSKDTI